MSVLGDLYQVVTDRKENPQEGSYTCYLFDQGIDKICKKCGEECTEMVIAAKNNDNNELKNEIADLFYHVMVLCANQGLDVADVEAVLEERSHKIGNLKKFHVSDHNT
ncbi:MAG: phosphoribosyl-ATP diphosphatase [Oscillospiraceae bacterium]|nr:phosphoribosyl-ATP diphosphatase [Oscillospiraceae bacterium]MCR5807618.1 phosphoribosyl-ATP diphosphatase [Oscillospiraceae bacterium]